MTTPQQPELPALPKGVERVQIIAGHIGGFETDGWAVPFRCYYTKAQMQAYAQAAVLADRESRQVVAWRYMPSPTWGEHVITQDPKVAEVAWSMGVEVEELTVGAAPKVDGKTRRVVELGDSISWNLRKEADGSITEHIRRTTGGKLRTNDPEEDEAS